VRKKKKINLHNQTVGGSFKPKNVWHRPTAEQCRCHQYENNGDDSLRTRTTTINFPYSSQPSVCLRIVFTVVKASRDFALDSFVVLLLFPLGRFKRPVAGAPTVAKSADFHFVSPMETFRAFPLLITTERPIETEIRPNGNKTFYGRNQTVPARMPRGRKWSYRWRPKCRG
jgi:hypothetical protein